MWQRDGRRAAAAQVGEGLHSLSLRWCLMPVAAGGQTLPLLVPARTSS